MVLILICIGFVNEWNNIINEMEVSNMNVLNEMIDIRDGKMVCVTLSRRHFAYY